YGAGWRGRRRRRRRPGGGRGRRRRWRPRRSPALALLGRPNPIAELGGPQDLPLVVGVTRRRRHPHPRARLVVLAAAPQLPGHPAGVPVVVDEQLVLRVDAVVAVREGELEQLRLGDRFCGTRLDAHIAVDAAEIVDLVDEPVPLAGRDGRVGGIVGAPHVDAPGRTDTRAELAADALLHAVLVAVEDVAAVEPLGLRSLLLREELRDPRTEDLPEGDGETAEQVEDTHQRI